MMMTKSRVLATFLTCLLTTLTAGLAPAATASQDPAPAPLSSSDGLTRDSMSAFGTPEPAPVVEAVPAPAPAPTVRARSHARRIPTVARRRREAHREPAAHSSIRVVKRAPRAHRNLAESFVYWWNGWVIRTFHTTDGTVLLNRIGAKA